MALIDHHAKQIRSPDIHDERRPWYEEVLVYSLLYGGGDKVKWETHYRTSVEGMNKTDAFFRIRFQS